MLWSALQPYSAFSSLSPLCSSISQFLDLLPFHCSVRAIHFPTSQYRRTPVSVNLIPACDLKVSPDVIRRYERVYGTDRSRRSTSCSSSEASDDDATNHFLLSRYCRRDGSDRDDDAEPPVGGGGRPPGARLKLAKALSLGGHSNNANHHPAGQPSAVSSASSHSSSHAAPLLDASSLIGRLQTIALAPIREVPWTELLGTAEAEAAGLAVFGGSEPELRSLRLESRRRRRRPRRCRPPALRPPLMPLPLPLLRT